MYSEDDLLMLSALQHLLFCERQCALIHVEQQWEENRLTAEGQIMHERVHENGSESRGNIRIENGVALRSLRMGLIGKADVVEYHKQPDNIWLPFPVEHKRGKAKQDSSDRVQLCAQAMCLEEMLGVAIPQGALFYGKTRRRKDVVFDEALRQETENAAVRLHDLISSGRTPAPEYSKKCERCSLINTCMPKSMEKHHSVKSYLEGIVKAT